MPEFKDVLWRAIQNGVLVFVVQFLSTPSMGRPRSFNETAILSAAVDAFRSFGYGGTSTRELVKRTGLNQPSLYNAFGDKRSLYRRALEHYLDCSVRDRIRRLEAMADPGLAVTRFFAEVLDRVVDDPLHRGCLLVNSALEANGQDASMRQAVFDELDSIRLFFQDRLHAFSLQRLGAVGIDASKGANHLLSVLLGIRVWARINSDPTCVTEAIDTALKGLGLPPLAHAEVH